MTANSSAVRHRASPTRSSHAQNTSTDALNELCPTGEKKQCKNRKPVVRMFLVASPMLLLILLGVLVNRRHPVPMASLLSGIRPRKLRPALALAKNPVAVVTLPSSVSAGITKDLLSLKWDKSSLDSLRTFMGESKAIVMTHLADRPDIWKTLKDLHDASSPTAAVLLKNLPIDPEIPRTPTDGSNTLNKATFVAEAMLLALGELSGAKVVGYSAEVQYSNPWVHEGFPRDSPGSALTAASELSYHQDMSYQDNIPDILGLYCLREGHDKGVWTTLIDVREIILQLPDDIVSVLRQPRFQIRTSDWVATSWSATSQGRPMLEGYSLHLPVHWENMVGLDNESQWALALMQEAILKAEPHKVHFEPGDLVFFNNQRMVHGRTPYTDLKYDGGDRVLNRAYFRRDLTPKEEETRMI